MNKRSAIEMIKAKLPIESVVGSYVKLEKSGNKFKANCPFHNEKTPSFQVDPDKGFYYCFGCHKGGDILNFVQEIEGVDFVEAKKILADKAGVDLSQFSTGGSEKPSRAGLLREIMEASAKFYEVGLRTNKFVVDYLLGRGVTKESMVAWRIGYAQKGWSNLYDYLRKKYSDDDILATGLCLKSDKGRGLYDRFRERIMFPVSDGQGRVIGYSARVVPGTEEAERPVGKYINTPETDLYHKSSVLYGFSKGKTAIHQKGFAILVEGNLDAVMAHQAGFENTAALSGTACTDEQVLQLSRFTEELAVALDADTAGLAATQKSAMAAYKKGLKLTVIGIPKGKDPADAIREDAGAWASAVESRTDYVTFRLRAMREGEGTDKVAVATKELFPVLNQMQFQMSIDEKLQEIAKTFGVSADSIRKDFERFAKGTVAETYKIDVPKAPDREPAKAALLTSMLGILLSVSPEELEPLRKEFEELGLDYGKTLEELPAEKRAQAAAESDRLIAASDATSRARMFRQFKGRYRLGELDEEKRRLDLKLSNDPDPETLSRLHEILKEKDRIIHQLHNH